MRPAHSSTQLGVHRTVSPAAPSRAGSSSWGPSCLTTARVPGKQHCTSPAYTTGEGTWSPQPHFGPHLAELPDQHQAPLGRFEQQHSHTGGQKGQSGDRPARAAWQARTRSTVCQLTGSQRASGLLGGLPITAEPSGTGKQWLGHGGRTGGGAHLSWVFMKSQDLGVPWGELARQVHVRGQPALGELIVGDSLNCVWLHWWREPVLGNSCTVGDGSLHCWGRAGCTGQDGPGGRIPR